MTVQVLWCVLPVSCSDRIMIWKALLQPDMVTIYLFICILVKEVVFDHSSGRLENEFSEYVRANLLQNIEKVLRGIVT